MILIELDSMGWLIARIIIKHSYTVGSDWLNLFMHTPIKGSVSSGIPCRCHPLACLCLSPCIVATKANQGTTCARHAG